MDSRLIKTLYREILGQGARFWLGGDKRITVTFDDDRNMYLWWGELCYSELGQYLAKRI